MPMIEHTNPAVRIPVWLPSFLAETARHRPTIPAIKSITGKGSKIEQMPRVKDAAALPLAGGV